MSNTKSSNNESRALLASRTTRTSGQDGVYGSTVAHTQDHRHKHHKHGNGTAIDGPENVTPTIDAESDSDSDSNVPRQKTPLPKFQLFIACFVRVTEPIAFLSCFPYINQMILDLGIVKDPKKTGFYAGLIESIFALAELTTVFHWGAASDRWGRKPVLLIGCAAAGISSILFGFSTTFWMMVATRTINGFANGNVAVLKSVIAELCDETNQSRAFSFFPLSNAIGAILASSIGGFFPHFARRYPSLGVTFPFLMTYPYLLPCLIAAFFPIASGILAFAFMKETLPPKEDKPAHGEEEEEAVGFRELLTPDINLLMGSFGLLQLQGISFQGLLPLYCFTPVQDGGLGFDESHIGLAMSIRGVSTVLVQLFAFPYLQPKVGTVRLYKILVFLFIPAFMILPLTNAFARNGNTVAVWLGLVGSLGLYATGNMAFACNLIMTNDAAPNRRSLGAINGWSQAVSSLMRAIGPGTASTLFALSVDRHAMGGNLIWVVLSILSVVSVLVALTLKRDYKKA